MFSSSEQQNLDIRTPLPELNIQALERMSDEEFWDYARQRAQAVPEQLSHAEYLECKLSGSTCLVALYDLAEVLPPPYRLARLPGMPVWMAGIMAWRGETIAVANLDLYLSPSDAADGSSRTSDGILLVVHALGQALGLLVPALGLSMTIEFEQIAPLADSANAALTLDAGIVEGVYADACILNISALLTSLVQQIGMATAHG